MLPKSLLQHRRLLVLAAHLVLIPLAYWLAFVLRFDVPMPEERVRLFWITVPVLLVIRLASFSYFRLFQGWWRNVGMHDLKDLVKAVSLSSALFLMVLFLVGEFEELPRSIIALDWLLALAVFGGIRFTVRDAREGRDWRRRSHRGKRALIIGAGGAAEGLLRQLRRDGGEMICPVALVDDDAEKQGMRIHGVPVVGRTDDLVQAVSDHKVELLVIAMPSASQQAMQKIVSLCVEAGVEFKIVPSLNELVDGISRLSQLRSVDVEDLLGRQSVSLHLDVLEEDLSGRVVVITGGAGSIGSELARQVARLKPKRLVLVDKAESPLYFIDLELRQNYPDLDLVPVIGDITDEGTLDQIFSAHRPSRVFHAAAYKHVPMMERNAVEAVRNNVLGTLRLAQCAARHNVEKFVLISTDKAVHPSSIMGATKRIAERIVLGWPTLRRSGTDFRAVRFGNVLGSDGSVIPLFKRQLDAGQPLTVTHPDVTRYFMTIPEAVQLVLQAASLREAAGRICMLEMGEPVRIVDLAENLIRLSGLQPYRDVPIVFTGLRPGEKLHEELMSGVEVTIPTSIDKIRVVQTDEADGLAIQHGLDRLSAALLLATREDLLSAIRALVPECVGPLSKPNWPRPRLMPKTRGREESSRSLAPPKGR
ncbi:nucleoside-diphosphate sugar epimerase/dehydratase [soil metagenome]